MATKKEPKTSDTSRVYRKRAQPAPVEEVQAELFDMPEIKTLPALKDDLGTMEYPFFSISQRIDRTPVIYKAPNGNFLEVIPSHSGRPTQTDKDLLVYIQSLMKAYITNPEDYIKKRRIVIDVNDFSRYTNRKIGGNSGNVLLKTLQRLKETNIRTNIQAENGDFTIKGFSFIDDYEVIASTRNGKGAKRVEVTIGKWMAQQLRDNQILTLSDEYYSIKGMFAKRIYELCRKHCGDQPAWYCRLETLKDKTGSKLELRFFRRELREIIAQQTDTQMPIPDYEIGFDPQGDYFWCFTRDTNKLNKWLIKENRAQWFVTPDLLERRRREEAEAIDWQASDSHLEDAD